MAWEKIFAALHPESPFTGIDAFSAVYLIQRGIQRNLTVFDLACLIEADHSTDDAESLFNRKTKGFSSIFRKEERHKEVVLGTLRFLDIPMHRLKTKNCGDNGRSNKKQRELWASRKKATAKHLETLDYSKVTEFFDPLIYDVGVEHLDVQVYLRNTCLPYWTDFLQRKTIRQSREQWQW
jgi:hypothetical protein